MSWRSEAACKGARWWFLPVPQREQNREKYWALRRQVCAGCPVRDECKAEALRLSEPEGMWGGLTPEERGIKLTTGRRNNGRLAALGPRSCEVCGVLFDPKQGAVKRSNCCSEECRDELRRRGHVQAHERRERPAPAVCPVCGGQRKRGVCDAPVCVMTRRRRAVDAVLADVS